MAALGSCGGGRGQLSAGGEAWEGASIPDLLQLALLAYEREQAELVRLRAQVRQCGAPGAGADNEVDHRPRAERGAPADLEPHPPETEASAAGGDAPDQGSGDGSRAASEEPPVEPSRTSQVFIESLILDGAVTDARGRLDKFLEGPLERMTTAMILLNVVVLCVQTEYEGREMGIRLGLERGSTWPGFDVLFRVWEHCITAAFLLELLVRMAVSRSRFFCSDGRIRFFNVFDFVVVSLTCVNLYLVQTVLKRNTVRLTIFRTCRVLRLLRTARVVDSNMNLLPLRVLVTTIHASMRSMLWCMLLLASFILMASLFVSQTLMHRAEDESLDIATRTWVFTSYGTVTRSTWTFFQMTFSGCWPSYVKPVVEDISPFYAVFFCAYTIVVIFTTFRVVTAVLLRDAMGLAAKDHEIGMQQRMESKKEYANCMLAFFHAADSSGDGLLSRAEFDRILKHEKVKAWLNLLDLNLHDAMELFTLLADGGDLISLDAFRHGIMHVRGHARSEDVMALKHHGRAMSKNINSVELAVEQGFLRLGLRLRTLDEDIRDLRDSLALDPPALTL